ncbi:MAG: PEP-CTERM sorting domain-containing protein [Candidatus Nealsonbacteria bacterium]|nr:PEP-CTERM sorting domain-containing protein [Candidatus Nealsonbacteria bacterium]
MISINFTGRSSGGTPAYLHVEAGESALGVAGVNGNDVWNDLLLYGDSGMRGTFGPWLVHGSMDESALVTVSSRGTWSLSVEGKRTVPTEDASGDLMDGWIAGDLNDHPYTVTVSGLGDDFPAYDVYVYFGDTYGGRTAEVTLNGSLTVPYTSTIFDGTFVAATGDNAANYVAFRGVTGDSFVVTGGGPGATNRTGPHGLEIVGVPEPSALVLLGMGAVSLLAYARRRRFVGRIALGFVLTACCVGQASATSLSTASYSEAVLADEPIGYWRLGEASGSTAADASGHGLNGTYYGGVTRDQPGALVGDPDTAAAFNGSTGYINVGSRASLYNLSNDFTVEAWVRNPQTGRILSTRNWSAGYAFGASSGGISFTTYTILDYAWPFDFPEDQWVHIAVVFDAENDANFYANGELLGTDPGSRAAKTSAQTCLIGRNPISFTSYQFYNGGLDEVAIYDRSLAGEELREHHVAGVPEPSTFVLLAVGLAGTACYSIRRRKRASS